MADELSPEQRDQLARLIEAEFAALREAALAAGAAPESVTETVEERRRLIDAEDPPAQGA
ncbi:hypothetical protein GCM10010399_78980 [Dactylosporangium fulvum]|uniref:Uncharacterized protein n=1 Tax=Dactylosporangium fulvum TaxID=53359 RepID=A0ABY5W1D0_9ACTN|nr:hypothetical protein [Dactylosporangium fulvum]UWP83235.1 hypothetical protein Dfulv_02695 [Dactylosporangium fulvum]